MKTTPLWPKIEICILTMNARNDLARILKKLRQVDYPQNKYQITVVDNHSTDGTKEMIRTSFPQVDLITLEKNYGMSALNFAFKRTKGEFCFVLDDDSYFDPSSLKIAIGEFRKDKLLGILACNIVSQDGITEFKYMPQKGNPINWCDFIGGGAVIRTKAFRRTGFFSPDILIYGHELDFSLRAMNRGYRIKYAPEIMVHRTVLPNKMNSFRMRLGMRNFLTIYWLYLSWDLALIMTITMTAEYLILAVRHLLLWPFIHGLVSFIFHLPYIIKHRQVISGSVQRSWARSYAYTPVNVLRRLFGVYHILFQESENHATVRSWMKRI